MSTKYGASLFSMPAGHHLQRRALGVARLLRGDVAVLDHLRQHAVARLDGALRPPVRDGVAIGRANDARQKRRFAEDDVVNVLVEVGQRAFGEAVNREAAAIAEINLVGVQLEDLLLGEAVLEFQRHHRLGQLCAARCARC